MRLFRVFGVIPAVVQPGRHLPIVFELARVVHLDHGRIGGNQVDLGHRARSHAMARPYRRPLRNGVASWAAMNRGRALRAALHGVDVVHAPFHYPAG